MNSFYLNKKTFPVIGTLDDMIAKTDTYVELRKM